MFSLLVSYLSYALLFAKSMIMACTPSKLFRPLLLQSSLMGSYVDGKLLTVELDRLIAPEAEPLFFSLTAS